MNKSGPPFARDRDWRLPQDWREWNKSRTGRRWSKAEDSQLCSFSCCGLQVEQIAMLLFRTAEETVERLEMLDRYYDESWGRNE